MSRAQTLQRLLAEIYGAQLADQVLPALLERVAAHLELHPPSEQAAEHQPPAVVLICYPDQLSEPGMPALRSLGDFLRRRLDQRVDGLHLLPFYPYSSDHGFSVSDYRAVRADLGGWDELRWLGSLVQVMFDAVLNHVSAEHAWFRGFLDGDENYEDFFISLDPGTDLSSVTRPRESPLLHAFHGAAGRQHIWTTFSADQVDLNYARPGVLVEIVDLLLFYVGQGARLLRLDAVGFLWKEPGTSCMHLPQTHALLRLLRSIMDWAAPGVILVAEVNVPHADNLTYFGDLDEAGMVYQFPLPPLMLHTLRRGDCSQLNTFLGSLNPEHLFLNFLASHDGIGLRPGSGWLTEDDIAALIEATLQAGGGVSYRQGPQGERLPYELNISYPDAVRGVLGSSKPGGSWVAAFLSAMAILLSLRGVAGVYFHSLVGSRNDLEAVERGEGLRAINRQKLELADLERQLENPASLRSRIFAHCSRLLEVRLAHPALAPQAAMDLLELTPGVFAIRRRAPGGPTLICLHEIAGRSQELDLRELLPRKAFDLIGEVEQATRPLTLAPYASRWLVGADQDAEQRR